MNQMQLYEHLKFAPQDLLLKYAQNPSAEVPQYLAMAAMQFQKEMKEGGNQAQPPQGTVKDAIIQQAMQGQMPQQVQPTQPPMPQQQMQPQQPVMHAAHGGLAELHVPDHMFQEHNMAGGGIVAFDEGGPVKHFVEGGTSLDDALAQYQKRRSEIFTRLNEGMPGPHGSKTPLRGWREREPLNAELANLDKGIAQIIAQSQMPAAQNPPAPADTSDTAADKPQATPTVPGLPDKSFGFKPLTSVYDTPEARNRIDELRTPVPIGQTREEFAGEKPTEQSAIDQQKKFNEAFGVSEDVYKNQEERLKSQEGKLSEQKQTAGWLALAQAGFAAAAGSSPYALKNIAEGGVKGLNEYNTSMDKLQDREDKLNTARFNLEDAQNRFRQTGSATALQQYNSALDKYQAANRSYTQMENNNATSAKGVDASLFSAEQAARDATNRGNLQASQHAQGLGLQYAQLQQTAAHNQAMIDMYDRKTAALDRSNATRLLQVKAGFLAKIKNSTAYQDFIAKLDKKYEKSSIKGAANPDYQRELRMYEASELGPLLEDKLNELGMIQSAESLMASPS